MAPDSLSAFLCAILYLFFVKFAQGEDDSESYLYTHESDTPVIEYKLTEGEDPLKPSFIFDPNAGNRVVEFYQPWCPTCNKLADSYVAFAKRLEKLTSEYGIEPVSVYAVSCKVHEELCRHLGMHSYPTLHLYAAGATNVTREMRTKRVHPFNVLNRLGITIPDLPLDTGGEEMVLPLRLSNTEKEEYYSKTKKDVFDDAFLSFDHMLRYELFVEEDSLTPREKAALRNWLEMLQLTLPPTWKMREAVNAILDGYDDVVESKASLIAALEHAPRPNQQWSESCTKGVPGMGYSCGLWQLLHIYTVGIVEWNLMVNKDQKHLYISTVRAASILRDVIRNFFRCEDCRVHFLEEYDSCAYDRCEILNDSDISVLQWIQLAVWLFKVHNGVNVRLLEESARHNGQVLTAATTREHLWPSDRLCPLCHEHDQWNETNVYKFIRSEYWIEDSKAEKYRDFVGSKLNALHRTIPETTNQVSMDRATESPELAPPKTRPFPTALRFLLVACSAIGMILVRHRLKIRTGRHKKR